MAVALENLNIISTPFMRQSTRFWKKKSCFPREGRHPRAFSHWKSGHYSYELYGGVYGGLAVDGFCRELLHFSRSSRSSGVERQFFGALDGEEFFAIEGSLAN